MSSVLRARWRGLLRICGVAACAGAACASPAARAAEITLTSASATQVIAKIAPDVADVGKPASVWMAASYGGALYLRKGANWTLYSGGALPAALSTPLSAATPVTVVDGIDLSGLPGLDLYVGYGSNEQDMLNSRGKLAKVHTVTPGAGAAPGNVLAVKVDAGPPGAGLNLNVPFVSVTVCPPGNASACQTLDHVVVDTGSTGLRVLHSAIAAAPSYPGQPSATGAPLAECVVYADGTYTWGSIRLADIRLGDQSAASVPVQFIGDPGLPGIPRGCAGVPNNDVATLGANGILGVGNFVEDCGPACTLTAANGLYYACPASGCVGAAVAATQQVAHPVAKLARHNNGTVLQLPVIDPSGSAAVTGALILGIGTEANNALGNARVLRVDPAYGLLTTVYQGLEFPHSFIDSGSNLYFLPAAFGLPACSRRDPVLAGLFCPSSAQTLSVTNRGYDQITDTLNFTIASARALLSSPSRTAFNNLGALNSDPSGFDFGLPFFFGRTVFTAIENAGTPGGPGPYVAY